MSRVVSWFSCGAASAVATKLALAKGPVTIANCEVIEEHTDNVRFLKDCERWFGQEIQVLGNDKYGRSIYEVFEKTRYLVGPGGARCTGELKKAVREKYQQPDDIHVFGYTVEEISRVDDFIDANNDVKIITPLIDAGLTKSDCLAMVENAGIELPVMYQLGYKNNNCRGCVKASGPGYWVKIRVDFPDYFDKMNAMEIHLGRTVCKIDMNTVKVRYPEIYEELGRPETKNATGGSTYWRPRLDQLPEDIAPQDDSIDVQCGIFCHMAEQSYCD